MEEEETETVPSTSSGTPWTTIFWWHRPDTKTWNITDEPSDLPDIEFIGELITQIKSFSNVDSTKIRMVGTSNGSGMTNRAFVEIDDPGIDIFCPIVSQMHQGNYRNGLFYYPSNEQNTGGAFGQNKGYDTASFLTGRRILAITNTNDNSIPYTGGPKFGSDFIHSQLSAYAMAVSQGYAGSQLSEDSGVLFMKAFENFPISTTKWCISKEAPATDWTTISKP